MSPQRIPQLLHHGKESIIPNLPPNHTEIGPGTYTQSESQNSPPTRPRLDLVELFLLLLWQNIKENISQTLPLVLNEIKMD